MKTLSKLVTLVTLFTTLTSVAQHSPLKRDFEVPKGNVTSIEEHQFNKDLNIKDRIAMSDNPAITRYAFNKDGYVTLFENPKYHSTTFTYNTNYTQYTSNKKNLFDKGKADTQTTLNLFWLHGNLYAGFHSEFETDAKGDTIVARSIKKDYEFTWKIRPYGDGYAQHDGFRETFYNAKGQKIYIASGGGHNFTMYNEDNLPGIEVDYSYTMLNYYDAYMYEFDKQGNWTKRIRLRLDKAPWSDKKWHVHEITYRGLGYDGKKAVIAATDTEADITKYEEQAKALPQLTIDPLKEINSKK
jgi:hypothetical protein